VRPELGKVLAQRIYARVMGTDDTIRGSADKARLLLAALRPLRASTLTIDTPPTVTEEKPPNTPFDPLAGLDAELAAELAALNAGMDTYSAMQLATQRVAVVLPMVKAEARAGNHPIGRAGALKM
jgi:hypothetical protein